MAGIAGGEARLNPTAWSNPMNEISSGDTTKLLEVAVAAAEFADELSDEALDRAIAGACAFPCPPPG